MASGKRQLPQRNDALTVMTKMFGAEPGWAKGVAYWIVAVRSSAHGGWSVSRAFHRRVAANGGGGGRAGELQVHCRCTAAEERGRAEEEPREEKGAPTPQPVTH